MKREVIYVDEDGDELSLVVPHWVDDPDTFVKTLTITSLKNMKSRSIFVPEDDRQKFLKDLADALGYEISLREKPRNHS